MVFSGSDKLFRYTWGRFSDALRQSIATLSHYEREVVKFRLPLPRLAN